MGFVPLPELIIVVVLGLLIFRDCGASGVVRFCFGVGRTARFPTTHQHE
jgi:hypothetical protein